MTYTVSSVTLNPSIPYHTIVFDENTNIVANLHRLQWSSISFQESIISRCILGTFYLQQVTKCTPTYLQFPAKNLV